MPKISTALTSSNNHDHVSPIVHVETLANRVDKPQPEDLPVDQNHHNEQGTHLDLKQIVQLQLKLQHWALLHKDLPEVEKTFLSKRNLSGLGHELFGDNHLPINNFLESENYLRRRILKIWIEHLSHLRRWPKFQRYIHPGHIVIIYT